MVKEKNISLSEIKELLLNQSNLLEDIDHRLIQIINQEFNRYESIFSRESRLVDRGSISLALLTIEKMEKIESYKKRKLIFRNIPIQEMIEEFDNVKKIIEKFYSTLSHVNSVEVLKLETVIIGKLIAEINHVIRTIFSTFIQIESDYYLSLPTQKAIEIVDREILKLSEIDILSGNRLFYIEKSFHDRRNEVLINLKNYFKGTSQSNIEEKIIKAENHLIATDTKSAINLLLEVAKSIDNVQIQDEIISIQIRLKNLNSKNRVGVLSYEQEKVERNQINYSLIQILRLLK